MGDIKTNNLSGADASGEKSLRGVSQDEQRTDVDRSAKQQSENTDQVLRTNNEEDTLYDDGLDLENGSAPLTGVNGRDDT